MRVTGGTITVDSFDNFRGDHFKDVTFVAPDEVHDVRFTRCVFEGCHGVENLLRSKDVNSSLVTGWYLGQPVPVVSR